MRRHQIILIVLTLWLTGVFAASTVSRGEIRPSETQEPAEVLVVWQRHQSTFNYLGMTTYYACDALQRQVTRILEYWGAPADLKVTANCSQPIAPARLAIVTVDFYSPTPTADLNANAEKARWTPTDIESGHPTFVAVGDCDLMEDMKPLLTTGFALRNLDYRTSCFPNDLTAHDFTVKAEVLKLSAAARPRS